MVAIEYSTHYQIQLMKMCALFEWMKTNIGVKSIICDICPKHDGHTPSSAYQAKKFHINKLFMFRNDVSMEMRQPRYLTEYHMMTGEEM